jgi:hypothetical protein
MASIRCPKCKLINTEETRRCRRCNALLSPGTKERAHKSQISGRTVCYLVVVVIAVSALCIYGFYGNSNNTTNKTSSQAAGVSGTNGVAAANGTVVTTPASKDFEEVKELHRDFVAKFDQNAADRKGEGRKKNQELAYETLTQLRGKQSKVYEASAQKYLDDFYRLVQQYYDQAVRFNSDSAYLLEVNNRARSEVERVRKDPSLTQEEKTLRISHIVKDDDSEQARASVSAKDIGETIKALRNLSGSDAKQQ